MLRHSLLTVGGDIRRDHICSPAWEVMESLTGTNVYGFEMTPWVKDKP